MRREPEGIEHIDSESPKTEEYNATIIRGSYDHSQEYDPYQSAAKQMQELLFGITSSNASSTAAANLRPSTNSAFQKYIPGNDVPSTADINNKEELTVDYGPMIANLKSEIQSMNKKIEDLNTKLNETFKNEF